MESSWGLTISAIAVLIASVVLFIRKKSQYWKKRGVHSVGGVLFGDFKDNLLQREFYGEALRKHYERYKHLRFTGTFQLGQPTLILHDPDIIKEVFIKDFSDFGGSGFNCDADRDPLSANLLFLSGKEWKTMRSKLTPVFTSGKIKYMFDTVIDRVSQLEVRLEKERAGGEFVEEDIRDLVARLATDVILSVTLGILSNSVENPDAEFRKIGKMIFDSSLSSFIRGALLSNETLTRTFGVTFAPKEVNDFFINAVHDAVDFREKNNVTRNDFLDLMIQLKNHGTLKGDAEDKTGDNFLTTNQIAAQAFIFFLGGFETTSSTTSYALFEVAKHPEIARKMQAECDRAIQTSGGKISYETVQSLEYMEMVIQESQRLHPASADLQRATLRDCTLPTTNIKLEKGTSVVVPVRGLHRDPDYFPNPDIFDPDRFSPENRAAIPPNVFLPFGLGPRHCIGMRFAMVLVKATILSLLSKYDVALADGTPRELEYDPGNILAVPKFPIKLKFTPRSKTD